MLIRVGYELGYYTSQPTPMILMLSTHYSRASDILIPDNLTTDPSLSIRGYRDSFGNWCNRIVTESGRTTIRSVGVLRDKGEPDIFVPDAIQHPVEDLPEEALVFLLASRYCETELLVDTAWSLFGRVQPGWGRVQAICDYVHNHITFGYPNARSTRTAWEAYNERAGVCRDFAHLAVTFCRCMNIPARYCTGYLSDVGMPPPYDVMDFAAWFEAYIGGNWYTFDPRNNKPRIGRILIAGGRDAADVAIATTFGSTCLEKFEVICEEVTEDGTVVPPQQHQGVVSST